MQNFYLILLPTNSFGSTLQGMVPRSLLTARSLLSTPSLQICSNMNYSLNASYPLHNPHNAPLYIPLYNPLQGVWTIAPMNMACIQDTSVLTGLTSAARKARSRCMVSGRPLGFRVCGDSISGSILGSRCLVKLPHGCRMPHFRDSFA